MLYFLYFSGGGKGVDGWILCCRQEILISQINIQKRVFTYAMAYCDLVEIWPRDVRRSV